MKNAVKQKLMLLREEQIKPDGPEKDEAVRNIKREAMEAALVEAAELGTCGMKAFKADVPFVSKLVEGELLNMGTLRSLSAAVFGENEKHYDECISSIAQKMQRAYEKYFRSKTQNRETPYSPILDMSWNKDLQLWERKSPDGWYSFCAYMPHVA